MKVQITETYAAEVGERTKGGDAVKNVRYEPEHPRPFVGIMHGMEVRWKANGWFLSEKPCGLDLVIGADSELVIAKTNPNQIGLPL